ncbi:MAG: helicase-exonuclease AddAB subunit AddA [Lachnospiraceae bacterium]|nr:helicase-exonuclease AddAB subunit AddA [Lachnospiraceae bacterium]
MAEIKYSPEQLSVIESRDEDLLVSAAAGSGKTAVLTARILSLLADEKDPTDIDRCLIVTFTKAAAAEMRERIGRAIADYSAAHPEDKRMERQAALLHNAQITTIDSFCLFVVRNNFAEIGLDPGFRILDEGEKKLILADCLDEILEEKYREGSEDFLHFVESYSADGSEKTIVDMVLSFFRYACSNPDPEGWIRKAAAEAALEDPADLEQTEWYRYAKKKADALLTEIERLTNEARKLCNEPGGPSGYVNTVNDLLSVVRQLSEKQGYTDRHHITTATIIAGLGRGKNTEDPALREEAKAKIDAARELYKKEILKLYASGEEDLRNEARLLGKNVPALCDLTLALSERFAAEKRERGVLDFTDMEHFALKILLREENGKSVPTAAAEEYRAHFDRIFVDEYQDSNLVQECIVNSIARENNCFCVGDVKQSIYRFRLARPEIFLEKYENYSDAGPKRRIDLNRNYRSRREVLDFVNLVFGHIMKKEVAELDYDEKARLNYGADYPDAKGEEYRAEIDVLLTDVPPDEDGEAEEVPLLEEKRKLSAIEMECRMVAKRILELRREGFQVYDRDEKKLRPLCYRDIVVLTRSTKAYERAMRESFAEYDIPFYCNGRGGYFGALEVRVFLAALKVLDNPVQDMPLHSVLVHFLELFTEDELARLRARVKSGSLYEALVAEKEGEHAERIASFFSWLKKNRERAVWLKVRELMECLMRESGFLDRMSAMPGGEQRRANLKLLLERASSYEQSSYRGLFHFLRYLSQLKVQEIDSGEAGILDEAADVVRLMTIHASKGLEFPLVFCVGLHRKINHDNATAGLLLDPRFGIAQHVIDPKSRVRYDGFKYGILSDKIRADEQAEEMRVLYVALTRAKEKLILTDVQKERGEESGPGELDLHELGQAPNLMKMIRMALNASGVTESYCRYYAAESDAQQAFHEGKRAFGDKSRLLAGELPIDAELMQRIRAFSEHRYAHPELKGLFAKTSVSELKHAAYEDEEARPVFETDIREAYVPAFAGAEETSSGTGRGSAYHRLMELLPLEQCPAEGREEWLAACLEKEKAAGRITREYAGLIRLPAFVRFLEHEQSSRMMAAASAGKLYREQPFFMGVPAKRLNEQFPEEELILIQGVIDAYWEEDDGLVLLDYKTDRVASPEELIGRYSLQLELYAQALEQIRGIGVKERLIYSFALDRFIEL